MSYHWERIRQEESRSLHLELCEADGSIRRRILPQNFPSSHSNGLMLRRQLSKGLIVNPRLIHAAYRGKAEQIISVKWLNIMKNLKEMGNF